MPNRKISKKCFVKITLASAIVTVGIGYATTVKANLFDEIWGRVSSTVNSLRDGVQLTDFEPLVADLLNTVSPEVWTEIESYTGINPQKVILNGIFRQKIDEVATIRLAKNWSSESALSQNALQSMQTLSQEIGENLEKTVATSQLIQGSKITQEVLKKKAVQDTLAAQRDAVIIQQNQEEKIDRAISNVLSSEILGELVSTNVERQRADAAIITHALESSVLLSLPGYRPEYH